MESKRVMIVEDNKEFLEELMALLVDSGYDVTGISESARAFKTAQSVKPDVIVLDLRMAGKSGFELADLFRHSRETSGIPVIAMTGFYTMKEHSWLMDFCGIKKCLKKPFNPLDIIAEIERVLERQPVKKIDETECERG